MRGHEHRGFALLVIMLLMAAMSVGALAALDRVRDELELVGNDRRLDEARSVADGGVMEVINDERTFSLLPDYSSTNLTATFTPPAGSPYHDAALHLGYAADIRLLRFVPVSESSQNWSRALVYEISSTGTTDFERTSAEVRAQVFKMISVPAGTLLPRTHAR